MSWDAIEFAFKQNIKPASLKFLLVAFADNINERHVDYGFPSIKALCSKTGMDRKTVISGLSKLEKLGFISDTKNRIGRTGQVKVYRINGLSETVPIQVPLNNPDNGTVSMPNSTVFPRETGKESRFSVVTVPKTGHGTSNVTSNIKLTSNKKEKDLSPTAPDPSPKKSKPKLNFEDLPAELKNNFSHEVMQAFIDHRAEIKKPLTLHALELNLLEAIKSRDQGVTPTADAAVNEAILAGWAGVNSRHLKNRLENNRGQKNETSGKFRKLSQDNFSARDYGQGIQDL